MNRAWWRDPFVGLMLLAMAFGVVVTLNCQTPARMDQSIKRCLEVGAATLRDCQDKMRRERGEHGYKGSRQR